MGDGLRTIRLVSTDESLLAQTRSATAALEGWELQQVETPEDLLAAPPAPGDVVLLDKWLRGHDIYELCRKLAGRTRCRMFVVGEFDNTLGEPIARFAGATGMLRRPLTSSALGAALDAHGGPRPERPIDRRGKGDGEPVLPERLLVDIATGRPDANLVGALIDPDTGLFNFAFLNYKLEEECARAQRFGHPLSAVMLGFEGQADADTLRALAGIFLVASRDTDVLGRFDESSFLFLLPCTGPDGARVMAERVTSRAAEDRLADLVGDPLVLSIGIASYPRPEGAGQGDLLGAARTAFLAARQEGGGLVVA